MKAYKVFIPGEAWTEGVTIKPKRSHAIKLAFDSSQEAGYSFRWIDFRAIRVPDFDNVKGLEKGLYDLQSAQQIKTNKL